MGRRRDADEAAVRLAESREILAQVLQQFELLFQRYQTDSRGGYPIRTADQVGAISGSTNDEGPVPQMALSADPVEMDWLFILQAAKKILELCRDVERKRQRLIGLHSENVTTPKCTNCGEYAVPRPRRGECERCYRYRRRTGRARSVAA